MIAGMLLATIVTIGRPVAFEDSIRVELPHAAGISIAGVFNRPTDGPVEHVLLLLPPAGPADADLSLGSRGIYRELAELLAAQGVASLRISSRGVAPATGDWVQTRFEDRVDDAVAAYDLVRRLPGLEEAHVGVAGISEGGAIALAVAARRDVEGVVLISTPMLDGLTTMRAQRDRVLASSQLAPPERELVTRESERLLAAVLSADETEARAVLAGRAGQLVLPPYAMVPRDLDGRVEFVLSAWYRSQVEYDVSALVAGNRSPVFAAYGELDQVIDGPAAAEHLRRGLGEEVRNEVRVLGERNHLMMPAVTGSPIEYAQLPELLDRELWQDIAHWFLAVSSH